MNRGCILRNTVIYLPIDCRTRQNCW